MEADYGGTCFRSLRGMFLCLFYMERFGASVRICLASTLEMQPELRFSTGVQKLTLPPTLGSFVEDAGLVGC